MPKQLFQRPAQVQRNAPVRNSNAPFQQDWSRKKGKNVPKKPIPAAPVKDEKSSES